MIINFFPGEEENKEAEEEAKEENEAAKKESKEEAKEAEEKNILVKQLFERRFEIVGGRIRLLMSPYLTVDELEVKLSHCITCIDFNHLVSAEHIDETGTTPSIYYSIKSSAETGFIYKSIDFCSRKAQQLAYQELMRRQKTDTLLVKRVLSSCNRSDTVCSLAGRIFEEMIHQHMRSDKPKRFRAKYLRSNIEFELEIVQSSDKVTDWAKLESDGGRSYLKNLLESFSFAENKVTLNVSNRHETFADFNQSQLLEPFIDWIPKQLNCPDYDALLLPFIVRQDTISNDHPFKKRRVEKLFKSLKSSPANDCYESDNGSKELIAKIQAKLGGLPMFPWFVYFVPDELFNSFPYQKPLTVKGHCSKVACNIPQFVVAFPSLNEEGQDA